MRNIQTRILALLLAALMQTAGTVVAPGQTATRGVFGAILKIF